MKGKFSIGKKMYIFIVLTILAAAFGTAFISYFISVNQIDEFYKSVTYNSAKNFSAMLDSDFLADLKEIALSEEYREIRDTAEENDDETMIQDYLVQKGLWEKYSQTSDMLNRYLKNMANLKYLYLMILCDKDSAYDIYLMDDEENPVYVTGSYEEREPEFSGMDLSGYVETVISDGQWGWLCSAYAPVYAEDGTVICHVGCDIAMDDVMKDRHKLLTYIIISGMLFMIVILLMAVIFIRTTIVKPLNALTTEMKKFKPSENADYQEACVVNLDIHSHDEINDIYQGIRNMQINIIDYLHTLIILQEDKKQAEIDIKNKEEQIGQISKEAYRDALTGVGSKAAYSKKVAELNAVLQQGSIEFALVMVDMNNLKRINDDFGHKAGDTYIQGCCHLICEVFKHSPVYRIGGDEFVVVLQGQDYEKRFQNTEALRKAFTEAYEKTELDPWLRYSASVGIAENASDDNTTEFVFKRADQAMYEEKKKFKEKYGSYR